MLLMVAPGYLLRVEPDRLDASRFVEEVADARGRAAGGDLAAALEAFDNARSLWRGPALAAFADLDFARAEATRLEGLRVTAVEDRADVALALGRHDELVAELENTVGVYPLRERPRAQLMLALYRSGRQVEALRAYQDFRAYLGAEVGVEPSVALQQLEDDILLHKPHLDLAPSWPARGAARGGSRAPSSAVFPAELAITDGPFVGRAAELSWLEVLFDQAVAAGRQVGLLVGDVGMGKTSLVAQFARRVNARGAVVVYARCDDGHNQPVRGATQTLLRAVTGSPQADADETFAPTAQAASDSVVPVPAGAKAGLVTATYTGEGNFSIEGLDAQNQTSDLLVNTIGAYTGTTAFGFSFGKAPVNLKVTASGAWTVKIAPVSTGPTLTSPATPARATSSICGRARRPSGRSPIRARETSPPPTTARVCSVTTCWSTRSERTTEQSR
jgi:hypothetical protein